MKHHRAVEYLAEYGTGLLDPATERSVASHVANCPACSDWLSTRDLLADTLGTPCRTLSEHPEVDLLALCVVRPEEVHEPDRESLRTHLEQCSSCRQELTLTRAAVQKARPRPEISHRRVAGRTPTPTPSRMRTALAAGLAFSLASAGIFVGKGLFTPRLLTTDSPERTIQEDSPSTPLPHPPVELSGRDLHGAHLIEGTGDLLLSKLTVKSGATLRIQQEGYVAFGDGFRIADGARVIVASIPATSGASRAHLHD